MKIYKYTYIYARNNIYLTASANDLLDTLHWLFMFTYNFISHTHTKHQSLKIITHREHKISRKLNRRSITRIVEERKLTSNYRQRVSSGFSSVRVFFVSELRNARLPWYFVFIPCIRIFAYFTVIGCVPSGGRIAE